MPKSLKDLKIGSEFRPFIIAEMSGNHNGSLDRALQIVDEVAKSGAQALKIQTYTADTMTLDIKTGDFFIADEKSLWKGESLYELYQRAYTPYEWHKRIFDRCKKHGLIAFSAPFDPTAVDFLETLDVPLYKVASFENTDHILIERIAKTGKPIVMSTGMAQVSEIDEAVKVARKAGAKDIILLKCTSSYPASVADSNLLTIPHMKSLFECEVGLSDHTLGVGAAVASVAYGATVIEKHFTLDTHDGGVDSAFSTGPAEFKAMVAATEQAWLARGKVSYGPISDDEIRSLRFRRTLYITEDIPAGGTISEKNMRAIRPGFGLPVKYFKIVLGKKVRKALARGTALAWDHIE
jgi:pseudaminic acid synthase